MKFYDLNFVPIKTKRDCTVLVYEFILLTPQLLWGHLLYYRDGKDVQRKLHLMHVSSVHRQGRFFPFLFPFLPTETPSVPTCAVLALLRCSSKVGLFLCTKFTQPQVYNVFRAAIEVTGDADYSIVYSQFISSVGQRTLHATTTVASLIVTIYVPDAELFVSYYLVS